MDNLFKDKQQTRRNPQYIYDDTGDKCVNINTTL